MWDGYVSLCYELTLAGVMSLLESSQIHKHIRLLAILKSPLMSTTAVDMRPLAVLLLLLVLTTPPPRWRKQFFHLAQQRAGATLEPIFLAQSQFFVSGNRKPGSKLSTGPEPALEAIWWKWAKSGRPVPCT